MTYTHSRFFSVILLGFAALAKARAQSQSVTYSYSGSPLAIASSNANLAAVAQISVPAGLTVNTVTAQVSVQYPNVADLVVYLYSARGTRTILLENNCNGLANINTTFDDAADTPYRTFCPQEAGRGPFRGNEPLSNSRGEFSGGDWTLVVQNTKSASNNGTLQGFKLTITGTPVTQPSFAPSAVVNAGSLVGDGYVAPGEMLTILGVALGPQDGVVAGAGALPTSLGGTTVTVDGTAVPLLYSSYYQLNLQVPFTVKPGGTTQIQVKTANGTTASVTYDVLSSAVGLFTTQSNGRGQVAAINQDGTVNSTDHPAPAGSYIALYATGLGAVTPAVPAGTATPTSTLSTVNSATSVVVGGSVVPAAFAGLAPGYVGLYQVNVQIPAGTPPGRRRVAIVSANGYSSQGGAYIEVQ